MSSIMCSLKTTWANLNFTDFFSFLGEVGEGRSEKKTSTNKNEDRKLLYLQQQARLSCAL